MKAKINGADPFPSYVLGMNQTSAQICISNHTKR